MSSILEEGMLLWLRLKRFNQLTQIPHKPPSSFSVPVRSFSRSHQSSETKNKIERIVRVINDHPFPDQPLQSTLLRNIPPSALSTIFVESVLGRLFAAHSNGLKALEFFKFSLDHSQFSPSSDAFEKTLHILTRMRYFDRAWWLMERIRSTHPSLLTLKSMSIMLSKISKFQSYESTLEAFEKMENDIFVGRKFGINEFNVLLQAFCTQRQMKEARSVFQKMHSRFSPDTKTMNILLLGFKETGDITAVELFYHEMVRRGFEPNIVTYNIRIDAYCKRGCFGDGLRLLEEMERANLLPTLETITTLIHGAGVARNPIKARQLFEEISLRNLNPDTGAYNALMSSFFRCKDVESAVALMNEMEKKCIDYDSVAYHTMFFGLMRTAGFESVSQLYYKMVERNFVPKTRTAVMLMKYFCQNCRVDLGLHLWGYLVEKGCCPHGHALDLLLTALCSRGSVIEAFECSKQMLERGRYISEAAFRMLEGFLLKEGEIDKLRRLQEMTKKLHTYLPPLRGNFVNIPLST
ncbi:pentatricopeptide repeat-containing protein At3g61360-like [Ziziphus jujuba]|uniref:Pentatricopeptide repeat-containing protein At3g61360-like n=1 Tax=Ziziphus jujuba TaxID=326968 RepID=A0A6P4AQ52_ZIZJJ|nr:pentatricopeptide repeat-containing protein At3g61360-like [Ziziphus jujuba]XP_015900591.2 pentatricopeptide repeat-containing protein At3g61360-like [Ziziphus jujuba]XP_015900598.2 pentatricopeptide repeat-containing protein At3g61360-like [Ziziphus jujuba]XP_048334764.2 pentatricopeptide repeat-containing protein At3g61360-like [Ziziphus jujuba]